jgi:hypothetical protein
MLATHSTVRAVSTALSRTLSATVVFLALLMSGCMVPLHMRGQRSAEPPQVLARKRVIDKAPPLDLIAEDGTRCQTTRDRFERTRVGSKVWCLWTGDGVRNSADHGRSYDEAARSARPLTPTAALRI